MTRARRFSPIKSSTGNVRRSNHEQHREVYHEVNCCYPVARDSRLRAVVGAYPCVRDENGWQVLHVIRWQPFPSIPGGDEPALDSPHLQCLCGFVYSRYQREGGQHPDVHEGKGGMPANRRSCRSLQRHSIRRPGSAVTEPGFQSGMRLGAGRGAGPFFVRRPTLHGVVFAILCLLSPAHPDAVLALTANRFNANPSCSSAERSARRWRLSIR